MSIIESLKQERRRLLAEVAKVDKAIKVLGSPAKGSYTMSTAARKKISAAQKKRWKAVRAKKKPTLSN